MADITSSGIFADQKSAGGLFRGTYNGGSSGVGGAKVPGATLSAVSRRETVEWFHDFIDADVTEWVVNQVTSGTAVTDELVANGILTVDCPTVNQGIESLQHDDAAVDNAAGWIVPAADRVICYEARLSVNDVSQSDWYVGLAEIDAAFMGTDGTLGADGTNNMVGFHHLVADAGVPSLTMNGAAGTIQNTELSAGVDRLGNTVTKTISDDTFHTFGIRIEGTQSVEYYIDDILVHIGTITAAVDTAMTPTFAMMGGAAAAEMLIDYVLVTQTR